ncbi:hypothetical protein NL676_023446 [Syzygium grande]|nr:hypothetical protein NL676_023446 [Syzygium grande]
MNLEFLEVKFFLYDALGRGLNSAAPYLTTWLWGLGRPPLTGDNRANLNPLVRQIIEELAILGYYSSKTRMHMPESLDFFSFSLVYQLSNQRKREATDCIFVVG